MKKYIIKASEIEYDITEEDCDGESTVEEIKNALPKEIELEIIFGDGEEIDDDTMEGTIVDEITDKTGWLVDCYNYTVEKIIILK